MRQTRLFSLLLLLLAFLLVLASCDQGPRGRAQIGQPAPDFILEDLEGRNWRLSDLRGQVVLLYFWATWCQPCREGMPALEKLHQEMALADKPFQMLAVLSNDEPAQAVRLADRLGITLPILIDPGVPEAWVIDSNGILRERFIGPRRWESAEAREILESYMLPPN
jgi:peroxiredoxin